jgi:putative sigma-54 modulation protein
MLNKRIKIKGMEMTPAIQDYVDRKIDTLTRFIDSKDKALAEVEIGRTTNHHHKGDVYKANILLTVGKDILHAEVTESDLYVAIDMVKDRMAQEITTKKDKKMSVLKKDQKRLKDVLKFG